jgi:DNA-binding transcriptional MerR regulator
MKKYTYKINEFAKIIGVTPKALRLYEKLGIFLPAFTDDISGYRYYLLSQLKEAALIIQLKNLGFSLMDIREYLHNRLTLQQKRNLLIEKKHSIDNMLLGLDYIDKTNADYSVYIKSEPEIVTVTKTVFVKQFKELAQIFFDFSETQVLGRHRLIFPEYFTTEYLDCDYRERDINAILRIGVTQKKDAECSVVPAATYLTTVHRGSYDTLYNAYGFLLNYMNLYNITPIGNPSERYLENYAVHDNPDNYLTEVRFPIK